MAFVAWENFHGLDTSSNQRMFLPKRCRLKRCHFMGLNCDLRPFARPGTRRSKMRRNRGQAEVGSFRSTFVVIDQTLCCSAVDSRFSLMTSGVDIAPLSGPHGRKQFFGEGLLGTSGHYSLTNSSWNDSVISCSEHLRRLIM